MPNPLNPLDWVRSAQDWFTKTERSSGFRPYLVFLILDYGLSLVLLSVFSQTPEVTSLATWLIGGGTAAFVALFAAKAFQEPEFCRSETHVQKMMRLEIEKMGTESEIVDAHVVDAELITGGEPDTDAGRLSDGELGQP